MDEEEWKTAYDVQINVSCESITDFIKSLRLE